MTSKADLLDLLLQRFRSDRCAATLRADWCQEQISQDVLPWSFLFVLGGGDTIRCHQRFWGELEGHGFLLGKFVPPKIGTPFFSQECVTWRRLRWSSGDKEGSCAGRPRSGLPYVASAWERFKTKLVGTGDGFYFGFEFIKDGTSYRRRLYFVGVFFVFFGKSCLWELLVIHFYHFLGFTGLRITINPACIESVDCSSFTQIPRSLRATKYALPLWDRESLRLSSRVLRQRSFLNKWKKRQAVSRMTLEFPTIVWFFNQFELFDFSGF